MVLELAVNNTLVTLALLYIFLSTLSGNGVEEELFIRAFFNEGNRAVA